MTEKGPWFEARYDGECAGCGTEFGEGDRIRASGWGGYLCDGCGADAADADWQKQASDAAKRHLALQTLASAGPEGDMAQLAFEREQAEAMEFLMSGPHAHSAEDAANAQGSMSGADLMDPTPSFPTPDEFMDPTEPASKLNVSGQPEARRDWLGRYIVRDPGTGDFKRTKKGKPVGFTRMTTFVKSATDSKAINDWGKRNVLIGASRRPDLVAKAHGLTHEDNKDELARLVGELETAAGAKVSADEGTFLHEFTEKMDAGLLSWRDAPEKYQESLRLYAQALADEGLEPVPDLIERTVMIREFGGIVGTFDRVFFHRPSGTYVVGDLKTGKTLEYGMNEIEAQVWGYAHGVNQNGVYDWNTDTWQSPHPDPSGVNPPELPYVREDVGVIIHMPVQGERAGTVELVLADLENGRRHAELCHSNRSAPKSKPRPLGVLDAPSAVLGGALRGGLHGG
ncbi:MAG TPA: hypothetical protein VJM50_18180 [Pyrinomonadaceae bacterium]|nr:hypothetical protein [Pyrinomonadaceae bacterium]